jgi:hypothetical protein
MKLLNIAAAFFLVLGLTGNAYAAGECVPSKYGKEDQIGAAKWPN